MFSALKGEGENREKENREKVIIIKIKRKRHMVQSHSQIRCFFRRLWNAAKVSASLIACGGRAFHSLGAEVEKTLKPDWCVFQKRLKLLLLFIAFM